MKLTAIILTLNEEEFIEICLESVLPLTSDVIVLDSGSTDSTRDIAARLGATVHVRAFDGFASQRNAALDLAGDAGWALFVDADERLTSNLRDEIREAVQPTGNDVAGFWVSRRNVVCGRVLRGGGWWPDYQLRLLRPSRARYDEARQVHEFPTVDGETRALSWPLVHLNYRTWREFISKQLGYAWFVGPMDREPPPRLRACLAGPPREFWRRYVGLGGYRDGLTGLAIAAIMAAERLVVCWRSRRSGGVVR